MSKLFNRVYSKISGVILRLMDEAIDRRICGQSLQKFRRSNRFPASA